MKQHLLKHYIVIIPIVVGLLVIALGQIIRFFIWDSLVVALLLGMVIRSGIRFEEASIKQLNLLPLMLVPIGVIFYGAVNLDFSLYMKIDADAIFLILIVLLTYIITILFLSHVFGLREKLGYLIAVGSTICGASAITVASRAIDADPDDVSVSLISVFCCALLGLFALFPCVRYLFGISDVNFSMMSGTIFQFTGFVQASVADLRPEIARLALSIKAMRYLGLFIVLPLFASFVRNRFHVPWFLWGFLLAGIANFFLPELFQILKPVLKLVLAVLWNSAMVAIGMSANIRSLFTKTGMKAFVVSLVAFVVTIIIFLEGIFLSQW